MVSTASSLYINKGISQTIKLKLSKVKNKEIPIKTSEKKDIKIEINALYNFEAPVEKNMKIGDIIVKNKDEFTKVADKLLSDKTFYSQTAKAGEEVFKSQQGALDFVIEKLKNS